MSKVQWVSKDLWIIAAGFVGAMHIGKLPAALPILKQELSISLFQAGLLLSIVQAAGMCLALLLGSYAEKIGLKRCVVSGLSLLTICSLISVLYPSLYILFFMRALEGLGFFMISVTGASMLRQLVSADSISAKIGLWAAYMGAGVGLALLIAPLCMHGGSWQIFWLLLAGITAFVCIGVNYYIPKLATSAQTGQVLYRIKMTLGHMPAWYLAIIFACYAGQWFALVSFMPIIYAENNIPAVTAGFLTALIAAINAVGTFLCGLLLQRGVPSKWLIQLGLTVVTVTALSFYGFMDSLSFVAQFLLVFTFSLFGGFVAATLLAEALNFAPSVTTISTTVGLILQSSALSQFLLPPVIAALVSYSHSWQYAGIVMALLSIVGMYLTSKLFRLQKVVA